MKGGKNMLEHLSLFFPLLGVAIGLILAPVVIDKYESYKIKKETEKVVKENQEKRKEREEEIDGIEIPITGIGVLDGDGNMYITIDPPESECYWVGSRKFHCAEVKLIPYMGKRLK